jgi:NAD(P)H-hydrate epimerase
MPGAAVLAANAALAAGVGLVTLAVPDGIQPLLRSLVPEVIVHGLPCRDGGFDDVALEALESLLDGKTAVAIGPGVGRLEGTVATVRRVAQHLPLPVVIDADGLRALQGARPLTSAPAPRLLTPHPGELAGLLGLATADIEADRPIFVRRAAATLGAAVVLKGAATLVAHPDGRLYVNPTGNAGMASAGTGDVLTGLMGGLMAQPLLFGRDAIEAASAAVYLHGLAGDLAADEHGQASLRASHVTECVSRALQRVRTGEISEAFRWC